MQRVQGAQKWTGDVAGEVLDRAVERDEVEVADHCTGLCQDLTTDSPRGAQNLDPSQFAGDHGWLRARAQPLTQGEVSLSCLTSFISAEESR